MNDRHQLSLGYVGHASFPRKNANCLQILQMCEAFTHAGCHTTLTVPDILTTREEIAAKYHLREFNDIIAITPGKVVSGRCIYQLKAVSALKRKRKNVLCTRDGYTFFWSILLGMPSFWEIHDLGTSINSNFWPIVKRLFGWRSFGGIITISHALEKMLVDKGGVHKEKILVAHDAAELDLFKTADSYDPTALKLDAGYKADDYLAVYTGKFEDCRGIKDIFYAAGNLPDMKFLMIGAKSEDFIKYRREIDELGNLKVMGFIDHVDIPKYLRMADVLMSPYRSDTPTIEFCSSLKIPEYMAMRKPIVLSDFPVFREVLEPGRDCLYFRKDDPDAFVAALRKLKESPGFARTLADNAFKRAEGLSWDNRANNILNFIEEQIRRKKR
ncbi:MAG TPA: hypothetical protein DET40_00840 [Lentisphaeria bacterium]|nr:MAG: hypothetical protein A2X45_06335 [Lentisphaerae bacterium GWF2_50_93]HCE42078.1 hypothetical protein [Lentisphaeria bacterium]